MDNEENDDDDLINYLEVSEVFELIYIIVQENQRNIITD